jgi:hypothetical protein
VWSFEINPQGGGKKRKQVKWQWPNRSPVKQNYHNKIFAKPQTWVSTGLFQVPWNKCLHKLRIFKKYMYIYIAESVTLC